MSLLKIDSYVSLLQSCLNQVVAQAKEALQSPYFDDLDKEAVDALESDVIRAREG